MNIFDYERGKWYNPKIVRLLLACVVSSILVFALSGAAIFKYVITIDADDIKTIVYTSEEDPQKVLANEGIALSTNDKFVFEDKGNDEKSITVKRASLVSVKADGKIQNVYITEGTLADALSKLKITVNDSDYINVSLNEPVNDDMNVIINRITKKTIKKFSDIPFTVIKYPTQTLRKGRTRTLKSGKNGKRTIEIEQTMLDGKIIDEKTLSSSVTQKPVPSKILIGDPSAPVSELIPGTPIALDKNGNPISYRKKVTGKATAYSSLGRPTRLVPGCVAMNLGRFPRGTKLYIKTPNGSFIYGYSEVRDTGTAVRNGTCLVDLFFGSYRESCLFGVKTVDIYVL